ncbi:MAG: putative DNA-binding domain-containing protein [Gammaproteobacteria bacterium]|nr:putative DNA-binding domain-containing protein [Gammaproteobacteria bacterium]MDE2250399.1 putative DNA-binding domain-containing protein [Gammaproteobacteria bacterium]
MHAPSEQPLAALQAAMSAALLASDPAGQVLPAALFTGAHAGAVGLRVHRNTVLAALSHALRLSHVAVDRLVGEAFFDRMAIDYARAQPPRAPQLDEYGAGFAAFIEGFPGTGSLPYLAELARFEWQLARLARMRAAPGAGPVLQLDDGVRLRFAAPLWLHGASHPVGEMRAAILAEDAAALARLPAGGDFHYALWRSDAGVNVRPLGECSARFLAAVYAGASANEALAAIAPGSATAGGGGDPPGSAELLGREILPAGFVQVERPADGCGRP